MEFVAFYWFLYGVLALTVPVGVGLLIYAGAWIEQWPPPFRVGVPWAFGLGIFASFVKNAWEYLPFLTEIP